MTGVSAKLTVQGDKKLVAALTKLGSDEERLALMKDIGAYGVQSTERRFETSKGPDGAPWKKSLRVEISGGKTLVKAGILASSFSFAATINSAEWGTPMVYGGIHQWGGTITAKGKGKLSFRLANGQFVMVKSVTMPARPFLGINEEDEKAIDKLAGDRFLGVFA